MSGHDGIRFKVLRVAAIGGLIAALPTVASASAASTGSDRVSVFASAPAPGHPFGIAVGDGRVYVSTSAGDFFADPANGGHMNSDDERVFTYDEAGSLVDTTVIDTADNSDMGLFGLALDGNPGPSHQLFVADMNGRILTLGLGKHAGPPKVFSQVPADSGLAGDWMLSMWNDLVFDKTGNLYVPDDKPRIWRVSPDGTAHDLVHRSAPPRPVRLRRRPLGGRIDPTGQWLYISITLPAEFPGDATIYRIRLVDHPTAADMRARPPVRRRPTRPCRAAGDRPRVLEGGQPLRQPARAEPGRGPGPGRRRDPPDLRPALPFAVGPGVPRQQAARDERRPRAGRQPGRLEDLQGRRRRDRPAVEPAAGAGELSFPAPRNGPGRHTPARA